MLVGAGPNANLDSTDFLGQCQLPQVEDAVFAERHGDRAVP